MNRIVLLDLPDVLNTIWAYFNQFLYWIVIIIAVLTGLSLGYQFRPRTTDKPTNVELFIDDELGKLIERSELHISWGPLWFLGKLKLLKNLPRETVVTLSCRAAGKLEVTLPEGCYDEKHTKRKQTIFLKNPGIFPGDGLRCHNCDA